MTSGVGSIEELSNIITAAPFEINGDGFGSGITTPTSGTVFRRNLCTNPSFETNSTSWSASGTGATIVRFTGGGLYGSCTLSPTHTGGTGTTASAVYTVTGLTVGHTYTASCYVLQGSSSTAFSLFGGATVTPSASWQRATKTWTAAATSQALDFKFTGPAGSFSGLIDGVLIEEAAAATSYFDGTTTATDTRVYAWTGTAHASTSTETGTFTELVNIDGATELDQIELTRDSNPGTIVFEDPEGTIQIFDPDNYRTGSSAQTLTEDDYSAIDMQFDMSHIVNVLTIKYVHKIKIGGKTRKVAAEVTYTDAPSIAKYGKFKKSVTIHKKTDFAAYAAAVFAKNADPDNVPQSVTVTICSNGKQGAALPFGYADGTYVGNKIDIEDPNGVTYTCRVSRIEHSITPDQWQMQIFLRNQNVIQRPRGDQDRALNTEVANNPDGMVLSAHIEDDIDGTGKTVTNATVQTEESGNRIVMRDDGSEGIIEFWSGAAGETKGQINPQIDGVTGAHMIDFRTSKAASPNDTAARMQMLGSTTISGPVLQLLNGTQIDANDIIADSLSTTGGAGVSVQGSGNTVAISSPPTGGSANVNWNSTNGNLRQISSARRFKADEAPLEVDLDAALGLVPKVYTRLATDEDEASREVGFVAEDAEDLGLTPWVVYDREGGVFSFDYFKWTVALQAICRAQQEELDDLRRRVEALERGD